MKGLIYIVALVSGSLYAGDQSTSLHTVSIETTPASSQGGTSSGIEGRRVSVDLTPEKYMELKSNIQRLKTEHVIKDRKMKCRTLTAFVGSLATLASSVGYLIYAMKTCGVKDKD